MKKTTFVLMSLFALAVVGTIKSVKAYTGPSIEYQREFAESGWNTPKYNVLDVGIDEIDDYTEFGPYACLKNTSGIEKNSTGNSGNTRHDVYAYFYIYDETSGLEGACMYNVAGTLPTMDPLHVEHDNVNYNNHFYSTAVYADRYRLYFKKAWNDTWAGTLTGLDYIFESSTNSN